MAPFDRSHTNSVTYLDFSKKGVDVDGVDVVEGLGPFSKNHFYPQKYKSGCIFRSFQQAENTDSH